MICPPRPRQRTSGSRFSVQGSETSLLTHHNSNKTNSFCHGWHLLFARHGTRPCRSFKAHGILAAVLHPSLHTDGATEDQRERFHDLPKVRQLVREGPESHTRQMPSETWEGGVLPGKLPGLRVFISGKSGQLDSNAINIKCLQPWQFCIFHSQVLFHVNPKVPRS